jgi:hypothetical protein
MQIKFLKLFLTKNSSYLTYFFQHLEDTIYNSGLKFYSATVRRLEMFVRQLCTKVQIRRTKDELGMRISNAWKSSARKCRTVCTSVEYYCYTNLAWWRQLGRTLKIPKHNYISTVRWQERQRLVQWLIKGRFPAQSKLFSSLHSVQTACVARPATCTYPIDMTTYGGVEVSGHIPSRYSLNTMSDWPPATNQISVLRVSNP